MLHRLTLIISASEKQSARPCLEAVELQHQQGQKFLSARDLRICLIQWGKAPQGFLGHFYICTLLVVHKMTDHGASDMFDNELFSDGKLFIRTIGSESSSTSKKLKVETEKVLHVSSGIICLRSAVFRFVHT